MKMVIIGANGNVGSRTLAAALAEGHEVVAYVRKPGRLTPTPGLSVALGDATDHRALSDAARDADALIVSITGSTRDSSFMQRTLPHVIEAARQAHVGRLVLVSVFGAGDTAQKASGLARLVYQTALRKFLADKAAADKILQDSGLDYTIVYPVNLKDAPALPQTGVKLLDQVGKVPGLPTLPYPNAGSALVQIATGAEYVNKRVLVTTPTGWKPL